ncbi:alpha/beta fold hydrolase, partial [Nocardia farcinica]|uniref:alpha/beta fold hydrolase n=1 Tax=Nocardia farcinica TaxID=37329 RepID=UPI00245386BD
GPSAPPGGRPGLLAPPPPGDPPAGAAAAATPTLFGLTARLAPPQRLGRYLAVVGRLLGAGRGGARLMQRAKLLACKLFAPVIRTAEFGDRAVSPQVLALANAMHNETSIVTMASFLSAFMSYDRTDALPVLSAVPTVVLCGSADLMTPPAHSVAMAAAVEYSDLVIVDGAGHSVILEEPGQVAEVLGRLLVRAGNRSAAYSLAA